MDPEHTDNNAACALQSRTRTRFARVFKIAQTPPAIVSSIRNSGQPRFRLIAPIAPPAFAASIQVTSEDVSVELRFERNGCNITLHGLGIRSRFGPNHDLLAEPDREAAHA
jgi:hypothetical protein